MLPVCLSLQKQREFSGPAPAPNLAPIFAAAAPGTSLMDAWVTAGNSSSSIGQQQQPLPSIGRTQAAVLSDGSGWLFHPGLGLWVMLKPPAAGPGGQPESAPLSVVAAVGGSADVERLQARAGGTPFTPGLQQVRSDWLGLYLPSKVVPQQNGQTARFPCVFRCPLTHTHKSRLQPLCLCCPACVCAAVQAVSQGGQDSFAARQAAYWQLTAAELLQDAVGYQRWLGQLVNLLARQRDLVSWGGGCCCSALCGNPWMVAC